MTYFVRNIDELPKHVPRDVINYLKSFPSLSSLEDITDWRSFCRDSQYKEVVSMSYLSVIMFVYVN